MSRTDDIRRRGRERGGSGGAGFVKWGDEYTWLEGRVTGTFTTKFGLAATFSVTGVHERGLIATGKDEDGNEVTDTVQAGSEVNVGLNSAALQGKITEDDVGRSFHVAFEGWQQPKNGNRYRVFAVIELTERDEPSVAPGQVAEEPRQGATDDGLPF